MESSPRVLNPSPRRLFSVLVALGVGFSSVEGLTPSLSQAAVTRGDVQLRLRRSPGRVDVVLAGLGPDVRVISQRSQKERWTARIVGFSDLDTPFVPQQVLLDTAELFTVRLEPADAGLDLIVRSRSGNTVPVPRIASGGSELVVSFDKFSVKPSRTSARLGLRRPGRVPQSLSAPPARPRAVAPPLGDMAVGTMLINNRSFVQASGPPVTLMLNNAPAKDALMSLARLGGYGFVFVGEASRGGGEEFASGNSYPVTMAFRNERYDRALNSVLMSSGLQGRLDGGTLLVGTGVSAKSFGPQMSKVFRLNQVDVQSAAEYLASLGAAMTAVKTLKITSGEASSSGATQISANTSQSTAEVRETETYGSSTGPLLGLSGVTDDRLDTVTLVGDPVLISVAQSYLKQLDLRKRQVAVKVQILTVSLNNDKTIDASFSARMGDSYVMSQSGQAHMNFGKYKPGNSSGTGIYADGDYITPGISQAKTPGKDSSQYKHPDNSFFAYIESLIVSSAAKTLAQPTLLVQEGESAKVETGQNVITGISATETANGSTQFQNTRENAGLTVELSVSKIDDNGFVTLNLTPEISVPVPAGVQQGVPIFDISARKLESGDVRLRDGQSLILTGVITDSDRQQVRKWPILGDMPLIGQLFRQTSSSREKNELVVILTPTVLDDQQGGSYGYGYRPGTSEARQLVQSDL